MKLPNLAIIFIIIILPLSVVLSTYMQLQIDVLNAKENYSTKLLDATYDGILSFELNSLSLDNVAGESVKSYVQDAVSTFFTTMSINMGSSGGEDSNIQSYVPAILFTTYDGYYIYSPVKTDKVKIDYDVDGVAVQDDTGELVYDDGSDTGTTAVEEDGKYKVDGAITEYNYMVKPFIYYSATYASDKDIGDINYDDSDSYSLVVNYSLDNHVALYGRYNDKYDGTSGERTISKSGYLINLENTNVEISGKFFLRGSYDSGTPPTGENGTNVDLAIEYQEYDEDDFVDLIECPDTNFQTENVNVEDGIYIARDGEIITNDDGEYIGDYDPANPNSEYKRGYFEIGDTTYLIRGRRSESNAIINNYTQMSSDGEDHGGESIIDYTLEKEEQDDDEYVEVTVNGCKITDKDAKAYYLKAYFFSNWVQKELGDR